MSAYMRKYVLDLKYLKQQGIGKITDELRIGYTVNIGADQSHARMYHNSGISICKCRRMLSLELNNQHPYHRCICDCFSRDLQGQAC